MSTAGGASPARSVLAAFFWLVASLAIMVSAVTLWAHQSVLTSDGWAAIVSDVAADPEVIENTSDLVVRRLSERIGLEDIVVDILPGEMDRIGGAITGRVEDAIADRVADFASGEGFRDAFVEVNRIGHGAALALIRDEGGAVETTDGTIALNVWPLIGAALEGLQENGFISDEREIPDLTDYAPQAENVARLEAVLDRDLPADLGTITLVESDRLEGVQTAVRGFDVITILLILLTVATILLAIWLSSARARMVLWLAAGAIVSLLVGRAFTRLIVEDVTGALREGPAGPTVRSVITAAVDQLMWFSFALIVVALLVAGAALWYGRRHEAEAAGTASKPVELTAETTRGWLARHARAIGGIGLGVIGFVILWNVGGPDIALLAAGAVGVWLIAVNLLAQAAAEERSAADETTVEQGPA